MVQAQWGIAAIGAQALWNRGILGSKNVRVCILDTGADLSSVDVSPNLADGIAFLKGIESDDVQDQNGHGTMVAGLVGAADNDMGISGVAPIVTLMPCRFLDANGIGGMEDAVRCLEFCRDRDAHIVHGSFGDAKGNDAAEVLIRGMEANGTIFVFSAGNDGVDTDRFPHYPSGYSVDLPNVISVAAIDHFDNGLWRGSNHGLKSVQIAAPHGTLSTGLRGVYVSGLGTSFAAPHVTGAAVLLLGYLESLGISIEHPNRYSATLVRNALVKGTHEIGPGAELVGGGMLHLPSALGLIRAAISKTEL